MKAPHLMTAQERKEEIERWQENAAYLAKMNQQVAESHRLHNSPQAAEYQSISDCWHREDMRLREILKNR